MGKNKTVLAIIPARGGSKGLPGKNIRPMLGKPLIGWTIEQAKLSKYITEIFVSTDCSEIAEVSKSFGVSVPELRPKELANDTATSASLVLYILDQYKKQNELFDYIILLEPTSPLRNSYDIDNMIEKAFKNNEKPGVVSLGEVHMEHPMIVKKVDEYNNIIPYVNLEKKFTQRQQFDKAYFPYGVGYLVKADHFQKTSNFYESESIPYFIERWQCYEVDDLYDFIAMESILKYKIESR